MAAPSDRYVLRSYSPVQTIGGGMILNTLPAKHRRYRPQVVDQLTILRDGETADAIRFSNRLLEQGIFVIGFGFPVVPEGEARLRIQMSAAHTSEQIERALDAFAKLR